MSEIISSAMLAEILENGINGQLVDSSVEVVLADLSGSFLASSPKRPRQEAVKRINGALIQRPSQIVPLQGLNNYYYQCTATFTVPQAYQEIIYDALVGYVKSAVGQTLNIGDYTGVANFDLPFVGALQQFPEVGSGVTMSINCYYQFIEDGLLSNSCVFTLDGYTVLLTEWSIGRTRIPQTDNAENQTSMTTVIAQQGLQFSLTMPYVKSPLCSKVMTDILSGALSTVYAVTYSDTATAGKAFPATVVSGTTSGQVGRIPVIQITLAEARGGSDGNL